MPVVARYKGWAIVIWFGDHDPAHVHVIKDDIVIRIALEDAGVLSVKGKVSNAELHRVQKFIKENNNDLTKEWNNAHA